MELEQANKEVAGIEVKFIPAGRTEYNDEEGSVVGWASKSIPDRDKELIEDSAWYLDNYRNNPVIMFGHDYKNPPVGKALWVKSGNGLKFKAQFAKTARGQEMYQLYKDGIMSAFSVGFSTRPGGVVDHPTDIKYKGLKRVFTDVELLEISCVPIPSNSGALVEYVKSGKVVNEQLKKELESIIEIELTIEKDKSCPVDGGKFGKDHSKHEDCKDCVKKDPCKAVNDNLKAVIEIETKDEKDWHDVAREASAFQKNKNKVASDATNIAAEATNQAREDGSGEAHKEAAKAHKEAAKAHEDAGHKDKADQHHEQARLHANIADAADRLVDFGDSTSGKAWSEAARQAAAESRKRDRPSRIAGGRIDKSEYSKMSHEGKITALKDVLSKQGSKYVPVSEHKAVKGRVSNFDLWKEANSTVGKIEGIGRSFVKIGDKSEGSDQRKNYHVAVAFNDRAAGVAKMRDSIK